MRKFAIACSLVAGTCLLAACGGGDGSAGVASTPVPPVTPSPTPTPAFALIAAATTSQQFAVAGASRQATGSAGPLLDSTDQLQVRYLASSKTYEVEFPGAQTWNGLTPTGELSATAGSLTVTIQSSVRYSSMFDWFSAPSLVGVEAVGIATSTAGIPVVGTATYSAFLRGITSETSSAQLVDPHVQGSMTLSFNFANGTLSGSTTPVLDPEWHEYQLGTFNFVNTVYSPGSTTFSGQFGTTATGLNSFSGLFTGPNAEELIGNFALPYVSPIDGQTYQASGAFLGNRRP